MPSTSPRTDPPLAVWIFTVGERDVQPVFQREGGTRSSPVEPACSRQFFEACLRAVIEDRARVVVCPEDRRRVGNEELAAWAAQESPTIALPIVARGLPALLHSLRLEGGTPVERQGAQGPATDPVHVRVAVVGTNRQAAIRELVAAGELDDASRAPADRNRNEPAEAAEIVAWALSRPDALPRALPEHVRLEALAYNVGAWRRRSDAQSFQAWVASASEPAERVARLDIVAYDGPVHAFADDLMQALELPGRQEGPPVVVHLAGGMPSVQRAIQLAVIDAVPPERLVVSAPSEVAERQRPLSGQTDWQRFYALREALTEALEMGDFAAAARWAARGRESAGWPDRLKTLFENTALVAKTWARLLAGDCLATVEAKELAKAVEGLESGSEVRRDLLAALRSSGPELPLWRAPFVSPCVPVLGTAIRAHHQAELGLADLAFSLTTLLELASIAALDTGHNGALILDSDKVCVDKVVCTKWVSTKTADWNRPGNVARRHQPAKHDETTCAEGECVKRQKVISRFLAWSKRARERRNQDAHEGWTSSFDTIARVLVDEAQVSDLHTAANAKVKDELQRLLKGLGFSSNELELLGAPLRAARAAALGWRCLPHPFG